MASKSLRSLPKAGTARHTFEEASFNTHEVPVAVAAPHYLEHRKRLREKFLKAGEVALADYELLELVLFAAIPRRDVKPLSKFLIEKFGSFTNVIAAPPERLMEIPGVGEGVVAALKTVEAAACRMAQGQALKRPVLSSRHAVHDYCAIAMGRRRTEESRVLFPGRKTQFSPTRCIRKLRLVIRRFIRAKG